MRKSFFQNPGARRTRVLFSGCLLWGCSLVQGSVADLEAIAAPMNSIFIRWTDQTADETGFRIERSPDGATFSEVAVAPPDSTAYTDSGLLPAQSYNYRVTALSGTTPTGSEVTATSLPAWEIPVPQIGLSRVGPEAFQMELSGDGATYTIQESTDLSTWQDSGNGGFLEAGEAVSLDFSASAIPRFYRTSAHTYERPAAGAIGLSMPFAIPPEPTGEVWDVTLFGASPANLNSTNDDAIAIKVAISIAEPGDIILIPEGTYTIRQTLELPSDITLRGAGMDATTLVTEGVERAVVVPPEAHDIRIEGFSITYLGETEELLHGVYVGSSRQGRNSYRILIDGLRIERFSVHGVSLRDCHHVLVQNCEMLNATNLGGGGHGYGIALNYPTNNNNWIRNNTIGPVIRHAILIQYYSHNNLVEDNLAIENTEDAYDLHGEDEYANELRFNIARDGDRDGFGVGNTGSTHDRSGPNNWIHHNTVENSRSGVEIYQGSDIVYVDKNIFTGNEYGIRVYGLGGKHLYLRGNTLDGNQTGVTLENARWIWLLDNHIANSSRYGIEVKSGVSDLVDEGNILTGNAQDYFP
ncbi:MAG: right-handed parallel beta-helix repeat-containing protein [Puniceicoccaceae bacterium]